MLNYQRVTYTYTIVSVSMSTYHTAAKRRQGTCPVQLSQKLAGLSCSCHDISISTQHGLYMSLKKAHLSSYHGNSWNHVSVSRYFYLYICDFYTVYIYNCKFLYHLVLEASGSFYMPSKGSTSIFCCSRSDGSW